MSADDGDDGWLIKLALNRIAASWAEARNHARRLRERYPSLHPDEIANIAIDDGAFWSGVVGVGVGAVNSIPTMGQYIAVAAVPSELIYLVKLQLDTTLRVAAIYEADIPEDMLMPMLLACLTYSLGHDFVKDVAKTAGQRLTRRAIEAALSGASLAAAKRIAVNLGVQATKKSLLKGIPFVAVPINAALNYGGLQLIGRMAKHYFSPNWAMCAVCGHIQPQRNRFCRKCAGPFGA